MAYSQAFIQPRRSISLNHKESKHPCFLISLQHSQVFTRQKGSRRYCLAPQYTRNSLCSCTLYRPRSKQHIYQCSRVCLRHFLINMEWYNWYSFSVITKLYTIAQSQRDQSVSINIHSNYQRR